MIPLEILIHEASRRLLLSDKVAAAKFASGVPVEDPLREREVLDSARRLAATSGVDAAATIRFFRDQIEASKIVQRGLLELWDREPGLRPRERPDLATEVRPDLDAITRSMIDQLAKLRADRSGDHGSEADAAPSLEAAAREAGLDPLHRQALAVALRSVRVSVGEESR